MGLTSKVGWLDLHLYLKKRKEFMKTINYLDIRKDGGLDVEALATCSISSCHEVGARINA
jgi:hypothetical protein